MRILVALSVVAAYVVLTIAETPEILQTPAVAGNPIISSVQSSAAEGQWNLTLLLGELFVFFFYWFKFNDWAGEGGAPAGFKPRPVRHFTTLLRYFGWNAVYGLIMVGIFSALVFFPDLILRVTNSYLRASQSINTPIPGLSEFIGLMDQSVPNPQIANTKQPPDYTPFMVMLVTVVWSGMRPFSELERRFRLSLQEHAAVPNQARDLIETFKSEDGNFLPDPGTIDDIVELSEGKIRREDFECSSGSNDCDYSARYARVEYLYYLLQKYKREHVFSRLTERYLGEFQDLEQTMHKVRGRITKQLEDIRAAAVEEGLRDSSVPAPAFGQADEILAQLDEKRRSQLRNQFFNAQSEELESAIDQAWHEILQLIVCSVLAVGRSTTHRRDLFEAFGLTLSRRIPLQLKWQTLTVVAVGTLATVFACSAVYYFGQEVLKGSDPPLPKGLNGVLWWSFMACVMHLVGIVAGYTVQRSLETQRKRLQIGKQRAPMRSDLMAEAAWATAFGVTLNVFVLALMLTPEGKLTALVNIWWWAWVPGVTALFAAIYTQQDNRYRLFGSYHRLKQSLQNRDPSESTKELERFRALKDKQLLMGQALMTGGVAVFVAIVLRIDAFQTFNPKMLAYVAYVGVTTTLVGLALAWILREWVTAEQHSGGFEKRKNRRPHHSDAKWQAVDGDFAVRTHTVSDNGAEITALTGLTVGTQGVIDIPPFAPQTARVIRQDDMDRNRFFVRFVNTAA